MLLLTDLAGTDYELIAEDAIASKHVVAVLYNKLLINCAFVGLLYKSEKEITRLVTYAFAKPLFKLKSEKYYLI